MTLTGHWAVVGGAGFIGGHAVGRLLGSPEVERVVVYDNFSSGRRLHLEAVRDDPRLVVIESDVKDLDSLTSALNDVDNVIHLASNPDIAKAATDPTVDFWEGTYLTNNVIEAMRRAGSSRILYASGSGVYGDLGTIEAEEDHGPMVPTSTYGASKLAGEALMASYAHMFGLSACAFRFGNVVGPMQTHGVGFDFARRLLAEPAYLDILGDGRQSKSYIHVHDVLSAVFLAHERVAEPFQAFNVATGDYVTVTEIADIAARCVGLDPGQVDYRYAGGDRGWKGDVPIVRIATDRIRSLGWACQRNSAKAIEESVSSMLIDMRAGRI